MLAHEQQLMEALIKAVIRRDYDEGPPDFPYHPDSWKEVAQYYHGRIGFLSQQQWDQIYWTIHDWNEETLAAAPGAVQRLHLEGDFAEALASLQNPPTYDDVRSRLGVAAAERYLIDRERIESRSWISSQIGDTPTSGSRRLAQKVALFSVLNQPTREQALRAYTEYRAHEQLRRRRNRARLRSTNTPIIERAQALHIWFPYKNDAREWKNDPRTATRAPSFLLLVSRVKQVMAKERCILQYIPKRRLTKRTVADLDRNTDAMRQYLSSQGATTTPPQLSAVSSSSSSSSSGGT